MAWIYDPERQTMVDSNWSEFEKNIHAGPKKPAPTAAENQARMRVNAVKNLEELYQDTYQQSPSEERISDLLRTTYISPEGVHHTALGPGATVENVREARVSAGLLDAGTETTDTGTTDTGTTDTDTPWMPITLAGDTAARPSPGDYVPSVRGANAAQIRKGNVFPGTNIPLTAIPAGQRQQYIDRLNADIAEDPTGRRANDVIFDIAFAASTQAQRDAGGQGSPHIGAVQSGMWRLDEGPLWPEMNINSANDRYFLRDPNTGVRTGDIIRYDEDYGVVRGQQEEGTGRFIGSDYLRHFGTNEAAGILEGMPTLFPPEGTRPYGVMDDTGGLLGTSGGTFGTGAAFPYYAQDYSIPHMQTGGLWEGLGAEYQPGTVEGLGLLAGDVYAPYTQLGQGMLGAQPSFMAPTNGLLSNPFRIGLAGTTGET